MNSTSRNRLSEKERYKKLNKKQRKKTMTPSQQGLIRKGKFTSVMRKVLKVQTKYMLYLFFFKFCDHYVYITLLIWSKKWITFTGYFNFSFGLNLGLPKLACPKLVYQCWKQPASTPVQDRFQYLINSYANIHHVHHCKICINYF